MLKIANNFRVVANTVMSTLNCFSEHAPSLDPFKNHDFRIQFKIKPFNTS